MNTKIFFTVKTDNPDDDEPVVVCSIYRNDPDNPNVSLLAEHVMTIEGARIRMHDLEAAIEQAERKRASMPAQPEPETYVYAVKANGEDFMVVAEDLDDLQAKIGTEQNYGQCYSCGSFGTDGEPVGYTMTRDPLTTAHGAQVWAVCQNPSCGARYPVQLKPSKEVCF